MTGRSRYVARRIIEAIPLIFGVLVISFVLIHAAPGDPVTYIVGGISPSQEWVEFMREKYGLNQPLYIQFADYISLVIRGDLGYSFRADQPVLNLIWYQCPPTFLLVGSALIWANFMGIMLGVLASMKRNSLFDKLATVFSLSTYSIPNFWLGLMLLLVFSVFLGWTPLVGMSSLRQEMSMISRLADFLRHLLLPSIAMGSWFLAGSFQLTKTGLDQTLSQDYIVTARAKGLDERRVFFKHALRNALLPLVTKIGIDAGFIVAGAVLVENVFGWPGLGQLFFVSMISRDYPVVTGLFIVLSISVVISNLVVDLLYSYFDPRVTYQ